jgi:hypothetical protein
LAFCWPAHQKWVAERNAEAPINSRRMPGAHTGGARTRRTIFEALRGQLIDLGKLVHLDEPDKFIPFDVRQPNGIRPFSDRYALISDHDLWAFRAVRAKLRAAPLNLSLGRMEGFQNAARIRHHLCLAAVSPSEWEPCGPMRDRQEEGYSMESSLMSPTAGLYFRKHSSLLSYGTIKRTALSTVPWVV